VEAVLRLRDTGELFDQPKRTPLDADYEDWCVRPAAEHLVTLFRADPDARVVLEIRSATSSPDEIRAALVRYAEAREADLALERRGEVRHGLWALVPTVAVFAGATLLSKWADSASSHWVSTTIAEALVVVGWVVLWAPIAVFGTDIWVLRGRRTAWRRLASGHIEVRTGD
jgi:hypothetical protein